jgi:hypothetical protein
VHASRRKRKEKKRKKKKIVRLLWFGLRDRHSRTVRRAYVSLYQTSNSEKLMLVVPA